MAARQAFFVLLWMLWAVPIAPAQETYVFPEPVENSDFRPINQDRIKLGQLLFFDPVLSGNKNISCATCHHPRFGTSDGLSLPIGEGGVGVGDKRHFPTNANIPEQRIGRNSPALFNLGAAEFTALFHDGRLEEDLNKPTGFRTPLDADMAKEFQGAISAQAMFPVLSGDEMAGQYSENEISKTVRIGILTGPNGAWQKIADRVAAIPEYQRLFNELNKNGSDQNPIRFTDIANAIADFIASEFRADNSAWDKFLRYQTPLNPPALQGAKLFYGKANCSNCHSGKFQSDHKFHAIAMPQFGPGRNARFEGHQRDVGRMRVTGERKDIYKFRTPSLRNIALSAPYGHTGAYPTLEDIIRHHLDPVNSFRSYDVQMAKLPVFETNTQDDFQIMKSPADRDAILAANQLPPMTLSDAEISDLIAFLESLTDRDFQNRLGIPASVPSGLPVDP